MLHPIKGGSNTGRPHAGARRGTRPPAALSPGLDKEGRHTDLSLAELRFRVEVSVLRVLFRAMARRWLGGTRALYKGPRS